MKQKIIDKQIKQAFNMAQSKQFDALSGYVLGLGFNTVIEWGEIVIKKEMKSFKTVNLEVAFILSEYYKENILEVI